jgi:hypothetical protein
MKNKFFTLLLAVMASVGTMFAQSGTCGDNLTWNLTDGVLTISGTGAMENYSSNSNWPWYSYRESITSVVVEDGVTSLGSFAFDYLVNVTSITLPNTVTQIGWYSIGHCYKLTSITIPASVTYISGYAFSYCEKLSAFNVDQNNSYYSSVDGVLFNKDQTQIISYPIGKEGTHYTIPNTVVSIYDGAFAGTKLESINMPNGIIEIGGWAFSECMGLISMVLPDQVSYIGTYAFSYCRNLESVTIPMSVTNIANGAFIACDNLKTVTNYSTIPQRVDSACFSYFGGGYYITTSTLYVPAQSVAAYQAADVWKDFGNILPIEETQESITISRALEIGGALEIGKSTTEMYVLEGYVTALTDSRGNPNADGGYAQYGNQVMWLADTMDSTAISKDKAFMVYQAVASDATQITKGAKITLKCAIKNYNGTIENASYPITVTILEKGEEPDKPAAPDTITVAQAIEIGSALASLAVTEEEYVIKGYVSYIVTPYDTVYKTETFFIADVKGARTNDRTQAFEVYRGKPNTEKEIGMDAYIQIRCKIKNYGGIIENATANIEFEVLEQGKVDVPDTISVAKALEIGSALAEMDVTEKEYVIKGYVSNIATPYDSLYKNETFWITDVKGTRTNDKTKAFEVYRGRPNTQKEIGLDAYVQIKCKIMNYRGIIENNVANIPVEILEEAIILDPDTITVAKALEIGSALESNSITEKEYVIRGYVSNISTPFDTLYKNETFWITDTKGARTDDKTQAFLVYRSRPNTQKEIGLDAYIQIKCKITNFYGIIENSGTYEFEVLEQGKVDDTPVPQDANLDVIYIDPSNNEIQRDSVTLHLPASPKIEGFTFLKWQVVAGDLEDGIFIQAVYTADEPASAPEVYTNPANHAQKLIRNGNVYILKDDKIYSITGQKVK